MEEESFKILTLNCWGVFSPLPTVRKNDRLHYLAKRLTEGVFDIIMLQEIWTDQDFARLRETLLPQYEHSVYFHSKFIGTGLCIFSKWPIDSIFVHPYGANGYPHMLHQGDWYCGKGIGLARVTSKNGFRINLYNTHLIARYDLDRKKDMFEAHRVSQLLELMQFIRMTSDSADAFIATGDYNLESDTSTIQCFRTFLGASDAWIHNAGVAKTPGSIVKLEYDGCTCDRADNPYRNDTWTKYYGNGERLDYIFYRSGPGPFDPLYRPNLVQLQCISSWLDFRVVDEDPGGLHYSDHEGVAAQFRLTRLAPSAALAAPVLPDPATLEPMLLEMEQQIDRGLRKCRHGRLLHFTYGGLIAMVLLAFLLSSPVNHWVVSSLILVATGLLSATLFNLLWGSVVGRTAERRALDNTKTILSLLLSKVHNEEVGSNEFGDSRTIANGFGDDLPQERRRVVQ